MWPPPQEEEEEEEEEEQGERLLWLDPQGRA